MREKETGAVLSMCTSANTIVHHTLSLAAKGYVMNGKALAKQLHTLDALVAYLRSDAATRSTDLRTKLGRHVPPAAVYDSVDISASKSHIITLFFSVWNTHSTVFSHGNWKEPHCKYV